MKKIIRLTESDLRHIVKESVERTLNELHGPRDDYDRDEYNEDGYDREGWNRNGVHLNGYNREEWEDMQNSHKAEKDELVEPSTQLMENISNYIDTIKKYADLREENTYYSMLYKQLIEAHATLTDLIDFLNDPKMGY
jgi:hypothetical protein